MRRVRVLSIFVVAISAACMASTTPARASDPPLETADGVDACREFRDKNERELKVWEASQPPKSFVYPRKETILDAPWSPLFSWAGSNLDLLLSTLIPHLGAEIRGAIPATTLSWPWSLPIGPWMSCSRRTGTYEVLGHRAHQLMFEPGIVLADEGIGITFRPGYRFVYHPTDWVVGFGGGLGSTLEIVGNKEPFRASLGFEGVLHFGHCCERGYFTLALRYDYFAEGRESNVFGASLGYVYF